MSGKKKARASLTIALGTEPPREFRIFRKGVNKTTKGDFVFDEESAREVMSTYRKHGVDVMIDLEHLSLDTESKAYNPDAFGWCKLEMRNGELWAVNVTWTAAGAERLREKKSRYISPAFHFLTDSGRITEIYNIAICAVPATHETPALVAASARTGKKIGTLTIEVDDMDIKKILERLGLPEDATLEDVLKAIDALEEGDGSNGEEQAADDADGEDDEEAADDADGDDDAAMAAELKDLPPKLQAKILAATTTNKALQARLDKLEKDSESKEREALIAANVDKLPKGLEKWARKQPVEALREYFKGATTVEKKPAKPPKQQTTRTEEEANADGEVTLSKADRELMELTGRSEAQMLEFKKKRLAKDKARAARSKQQDDEDEEDAA